MVKSSSSIRSYSLLIILNRYQVTGDTRCKVTVKFPKINCYLTTIARESLVASYVGRISGTFAGDGIVLKTSGCCTAGRPSSGLKSTLLGKIITTTSGSQKVLARPVSVNKVVGTGTDGVKSDAIDNSVDTTQGTVVTATTSNLKVPRQFINF